ncbi:hypothetical protein SNE35_30950 [Paucibacter sp. R3-3]|uniref:Uncharacterized protein n=1 Tax=Roseateles agri TaxID=3098619 RepID=A0ABU5DRK6_9BURK|nr:hypothetical protein [Paucibacter sp. R3-3]MDY0748957.1 hypothetical protein [Paucibacter sp. R3-3]
MVLIHGAIVLVAWQLRTPARHVNAQVLLTTMRLIEPRAVPPPAKPARPAEAARSSLAVALPAPLPMPAIEVQQPAPSPATAVEAWPAAQGRVGLDGRAIAAPGPAASAPTGLSLKPSREVMRGALANLATSDPRSNTPKPTFEEKIAMGLDDTLCLKQERMPDGSVRRRLIHRSAGQTTLSATAGTKTGTILVCE